MIDKTDLLPAYSILDLKRFEGLYALMDVDGDGVVTEDELAVLLKTLGETLEPKQVRTEVNCGL